MRARRVSPECCTISRGSTRRRRLIAECEARGLPHRRRIEREHPVLLHARLGAAIARERIRGRGSPRCSPPSKSTRPAPPRCRRSTASSISPIRSSRPHVRRARALWELALHDLARDARVLASTLRHQRAKASRRRQRSPRRARRRGVPGGARIGELIEVVRDSALDKKGEAFTALDVSGRTILGRYVRDRQRAFEDSDAGHRRRGHRSGRGATATASRASKATPTDPGFSSIWAT